MSRHRTAQETLPVVLVGAGLPQIVGHVRSVLNPTPNGYSNSLASARCPHPMSAVPWWNRPPPKAWYSSPPQSRPIAEATEGCAVFPAGSGPATPGILARASPSTAHDVAVAGASRCAKRLDESFFRVRFDRLTPRERDYARAMQHWLGRGSIPVGATIGRPAPQTAPGARTVAPGPHQQGHRLQPRPWRRSLRRAAVRSVPPSRHARLGAAETVGPTHAETHRHPSILIIGAGPIVIGQACEFDYSGAQACKALRAEGYSCDPGQLQPGHHHDRSRTGRPHLHRADHARMVEKIIAARSPTRSCPPWADRPRSTRPCSSTRTACWRSTAWS